MSSTKGRTSVNAMAATITRESKTRSRSVPPIEFMNAPNIASNDIPYKQRVYTPNYPAH